MGNWHCVTSNCAKVVYREYLPPSIRYRYEGEDWNEITGEGLTYTFELTDPPFSGGQCLGTRYYCTIEFLNPSNGVWRTASTKSGFNLTMYAPVSGWELIPLNTSHVPPRYQVAANGKDINGNPVQHLFRFNGTGAITYNGQYGQSRTAVDLRNFKVVFNDSNQQDTGTCGNPPGDCIFKVFKDGVVVHEETRPDCPEVEQLDCHLSDEYKEIIIDKLPYLERVEVVPYAYQNFGLNVYQANIPDECLNIYKNLTTTIIPQFEGLPTPTNASQATYGYIAQICSHPLCPPPEYQVICDCNSCESCPSGTCAVECGDHICCYGDDGVAVKSINKENYCNG